MPDVFIFHGAYSTPQSNWFPWLKEQLEEIGCRVFVPQFPTPDNQTLDGWLKAFDRFEKDIDKNTIFIGHSLGAAFILSLLERMDMRIRAAFLVAGFVSPVVDSEGILNTINKTFYEKQFDWDRIKENCGEFYVINSDNDPYIPTDIAERVSMPLGVRLIVIEGGGHFSSSDGYARFQQLLEMVEDLLRTGLEK